MDSETDLKILMLEDISFDSELIEWKLKKESFKFTLKRVDNKGSFLNELREFKPDIILADYNLPEFNGISALKFANEIHPETPFIFISGVVNEEFAIQALKLGATDYVLKDNLDLLAPVIRRILKQTEQRNKLYQAERKLIQLENYWKNMLDSFSHPVFFTDENQSVKYINRYFCKLVGQDNSNLIHRDCAHINEKILNLQDNPCTEARRSLKSIKQTVRIKDKPYLLVSDPGLDENRKYLGCIVHLHQQ
ncbi:MAG: response regulator [Vulcanimicrobiota bacterium]